MMPMTGCLGGGGAASPDSPSFCSTGGMGGILEKLN